MKNSIKNQGSQGDLGNAPNYKNIEQSLKRKRSAINKAKTKKVKHKKPTIQTDKKRKVIKFVE